MKEAQTKAMAEGDKKEERLGKTFVFEENKQGLKMFKNHLGA